MPHLHRRSLVSPPFFLHRRGTNPLSPIGTYRWFLPPPNAPIPGYQGIAPPWTSRTKCRVGSPYLRIRRILRPRDTVRFSFSLYLQVLWVIGSSLVVWLGLSGRTMASDRRS